MDQLRSAAEVYRLLHNNKYKDGNNHFANTVGGDGLLISGDITAAGGFLTVNVSTDGTAYCMSSPLNGTDAGSICMDSKGKVTRSATAICSGSGTTCPN